MSLRRFLSMMVVPLYAAVVAALIFLLSGSPYEFMIGEVQDNKPVTICNLPTPVDDARDVYAPITCALVLVLLIAGSIRSIRYRRINFTLVVGCVLLLIWTYRFFLRTLGC